MGRSRSEIRRFFAADVRVTPTVKVVLSTEEEKEALRIKRREDKREQEAKYNEVLSLYRTVEDLDFSSSSEISEDEEYNYDIFMYAKEVVMTAYTPIYMQYVDRNRAYYVNEFRAHIKEFMPRRYHTFNYTPTFCKPLVRHRLRKNDVVSWHQSSIHIMLPCFIQEFQSSPMRRRTKYYYPTGQSIPAIKRLRLSNLPYIDEWEDTSKLCLYLRELYPLGVHGEHRGWGLPMTDELLYLLLDKVLNEWQSDIQPETYVYYAIYKLFPNKLSPEELKDAYSALKKRFANRGREKKTEINPVNGRMSSSTFSSSFFSIIDFNDPSISYRSMDNSHKKCDFEKCKEMIEQAVVVADVGEDNSLKYEACGPDCYKLEDHYNSKELKPEQAPSICRAVVGPLEDWRADCMFRVLTQMQRYTPCYVSEMISLSFPKDKRTCREILIMVEDEIEKEKKKVKIDSVDSPKRKKMSNSPNIGLKIEVEDMRDKIFNSK